MSEGKHASLTGNRGSLPSSPGSKQVNRNNGGLIELETILEQCKKHNREAQASLYTWLAPKLLGLCIRYLRDRDDAEDVMQDAFVKIFTNLHAFKGEGSFEGWAKRIAVNTALTALKKNYKIRFERQVDALEFIGQEEEEPATWTTDDIMSCMNDLPVGYRTIMNLFLVEEFSHKEISEKLGISESTSRSQYSRARKALLLLMKQKEDLEPSQQKAGHIVT